jgi:hypothetical protein
MAEPARPLEPAVRKPRVASREHVIAHDRRRSSRVPISLGVSLEAGRQRLVGIATDVGLGGMFVSSAESLAYGTRVNVRLDLGDVGVEVRVTGVVRWVTALGFGVQFGALGVHETRALVRVLASARDELSSKSTR